MPSEEKKSPMYIASLAIKNIKCFGNEQILDLKSKNGAVSPWSLILGDNGVGKTTLLKCLAWMIPVEETDKTKKDEADIPDEVIAIKPFMDGFETNEEYEQLIRLGNEVNSKVSATFTTGTPLGKIPESDQLVSHGIIIQTKDNELEDINLEYGKLAVYNSPNLFAYGASRHMAYKNFDDSELKDPTSNLFSDSGDLYDAEQLLTILDNASIRQARKGKASDLLSKVKQILVDLLPYLTDPKSIIINPQLNEDGSTNDTLVEIQTPDGKVPLFNLSLGYMTMLAWTVDLALRMLWRNPDSENPLYEPAVVIVDEIDLHLHPKWQRMVRQNLTKHFPNTQFICTAHSPFMAQSSELENLCVINRLDDEVTIENDPYVVRGWRIGQVITSDLFDIKSERSPEVEELIEKRRIILDKKIRSAEEEIELKSINEELSKLPIVDDDEDQKLLNQIRITAEFLKKEGKLK